MNIFNSNLSEIRNNKKEIKYLSNIIKEKFKNKKIYLLIDNDDGFYHNIFKFNLYPNKINLKCWSFKRNKKQTTYMFDCNYLNDEEILERLKKYQVIVNYKNNKTYRDILNKNNYKKINIKSSSSIYVEN